MLGFCVLVWSTRNYRCLKTLEGHDSRVSGVDILTNKVGVVSCSHDKTWKLWSYDELCVCLLVIFVLHNLRRLSTNFASYE